MFQSPNNSAIMGAAPRERMGVASGLISLSRTLGSTTGLPLIGSIFTAQVLASGGFASGADVTSAPAAELVSGIAGTYHIAVYFIFAAILLAIFAWWLERRQKAAQLAPEPAAPDAAQD